MDSRASSDGKADLHDNASVVPRDTAELLAIWAKLDQPRRDALVAVARGIYGWHLIKSE